MIPLLPSDPKELHREISASLKSAGIPDAEKEAELLIIHFAGIDRVALWRDLPPIPDEALRDIQNAMERREQGEPLHYILGEVEFWGLQIAVGPGVLIPRPETELIVEEVIGLAGMNRELRILDLCTGSGCLALALAKELPGSRVTGSDISETAVNYAARNAITNGIANARFLHGHLFETVPDERFDIIVSNPPYIVSSEIDTLQIEIREHEPREALDGGAEGLDFYRDIITEALGHLVPGGHIILELGMGQAGQVTAIARNAGFEVLKVKKDLAGIGRVLIARLSNA